MISINYLAKYNQPAFLTLIIDGNKFWGNYDNNLILLKHVLIMTKSYTYYSSDTYHYTTINDKNVNYEHIKHCPFPILKIEFSI